MKGEHSLKMLCKLVEGEGKRVWLDEGSTGCSGEETKGAWNRREMSRFWGRRSGDRCASRNKVLKDELLSFEQLCFGQQEEKVGPACQIAGGQAGKLRTFHTGAAEEAKELEKSGGKQAGVKQLVLLDLLW
ncbi:hypothetical protein RTBOTA2_002874, partial [Rhodotorula toruloides]